MSPENRLPPKSEKMIRTLFTANKGRAVLVERMKKDLEKFYATPEGARKLGIEADLRFADAYLYRATEIVRALCGYHKGPSMDFVEVYIERLQGLLKKQKEDEEREQNPCKNGHTWDEMDDGSSLCFECDSVKNATGRCYFCTALVAVTGLVEKTGICPSCLEKRNLKG